MDETIERNELKKENPAPQMEEQPAEAAEPVETVSEEAPESAPAEKPEADEVETPEIFAQEESQDEISADTQPEEKAEEADAPLVMPAPMAEVDDMAMPSEPAPAPIPAGPAEKLFNGLSYLGLPVLIMLAAAVSFLGVWMPRGLWLPHEALLGDALAGLQNSWLMVTVGGQPCPDLPPLFVWFMDAFTNIPGVALPALSVIFLAAAVAHALFIASVWALARGTGHDRRTAFASGLVALSCVFISGTACSPGVDLFFAALVTFGMTCLYKGWVKFFAPFWLALGWLVFAAATLTKGPLGIAFAIVTSVIFLFWRCTPGRLNSRDGLPGFFLMLVVLAAWLGALYLDGQVNYIRSMGELLIQKILPSGRFGEQWWFYLIALPIIWLPWILLPLFVNWYRALRGMPAAVKARKTDGGSSWLWIWFVTGVALLTALQAKCVLYALPLLAPLAVLTGRSLLRLSAGRSRCFFGLSAAFMALVGLALVLVDVYPFLKPYIPAGWLPPVPACVEAWLTALNGTMYMGGILILTAVALLSLTRLALPGGALLITTLGMIALVQPFHWFVVPSMEAMLAPKAAVSVPAPETKAEPALPAEAAAPVEQPEAKPAEAQPAALNASTPPAAPSENAPAEIPAETKPAPEDTPTAPVVPAGESAPATEAPATPAEPAPAAEQPQPAATETPAEKTPEVQSETPVVPADAKA